MGKKPPQPEWKQRQDELRRLRTVPLTQERIDGLPDDDLVSVVYGRIVARMAERLGDEWGRTDAELARMPHTHRHIFHAVLTDFEVRNGGFDQCIYNSAGAHMDQAVEALLFFQASEHAAIVQRVFELLSRAMKETGDSPLDEAQRWAAARLLPAAELEDLDRKYYRLVEQDDFYSNIAQYVRDHPEEFIGV